MSTNASARYSLNSTVTGNPSVGVWCNTTQSSQIVTLGPDCHTWFATQPIANRGPYRLAVNPYAFTDEVSDEVFASNDPANSKEWTILPIEVGDGFCLCYISSDNVGSRVWTTFGIANHIKIASFTGNPEQVFKFVKQ